MGVSKVTLNGVTLMDVTDKTVDTDNLLAGNSALRNDGESITGAVVTASPSDASPAMDGTASAGVATTYSRGDHVHPSDTNKANINNPSFTGIPTAPTASKGTNTTQIATTAFVQSAIADINYPVTSINSKTGTVVLTASDVNALPDDTEIPTKTSDLTNDAGYITTSDIPVTSVNTKTGAVILTASDVGALPDSTDVTKWNGVRLANQIGVNTGDTTYVVSLGNSTSLGAVASKYPVTRIPTAHNIPKYDANSYLISTTPAASDNSTKVATTAYVDSAISNLGSILNYKGTKATESALPSTGNVTGDVWIVSADNSEYVWNGTAWEKLGPTIDLSGYVPTTRTVNGKALSTDILLDASDVGALADDTAIPRKTSDLTNDSGFITSADVPVTSVNSKTGDVSLTASDVNAVPSNMSAGNISADVTIPSKDTSGDYYWAKASKTPAAYRIAKYDSSAYLNSTTPSADDSSTKVATTAFVKTAVDSISVPVTSVNSKTGTVVLTAADVGALPDSTVIPTATSDLTNDSGFITSSDIPVTSVNTKTGAVVLTAADVNAQPQINISGILKGNGTGTITAATAGTDYQAPLPSQTGNTGKFLTTNGSALSWQTVDALPSQSGNTGKFLTTNGSSASWAEVDVPTKTSDLTNDSNFVSDASYVHTDNNFTTTLKNKLDGTSNRNLLDNAYFVGGGSQLGDGIFPINQRGKTSYTGSTYTIDRWVISSSAITVTLNAGYIELSGTAGNNFSQVIAPETAKALYGKTVTVSALMYDGTILTGTGIFPTRPASSWNYVGFVYGTDAALIVGTNQAGRSEFFIQTQSASAKVKAVKLELGTVSTLANDAPPVYSEELARCIYSTADPTDTYANAGYGTSNRNLLDNWYFVGGGSQRGNEAFPINQKGSTSYSGTGNSIDRWAKSNTYGTLTLGTDYITFTNNNSSNTSSIYQYIKTIPANTTVTLSAKVRNGQIVIGFYEDTEETYYTRTFTVGSSWEIVSIPRTITHSCSRIVLRTLAGKSIQIESVKLEYGSISTLANDAPPDYWEELEKCQHYLWVASFPSGSILSTGYASDSFFITDIILPTTIRGSNLTLTFNANVLIIGNGTAVVAASVVGVTRHGNHLRTYITPASALTGQNLYALVASTDTVMVVSAEL